MAIKTILMPLRRSDATETLLEAGPALAHRFDAHLDVLCVRPDPSDVIPFATLGLSRNLKASVLEASERNAKAEAEGLRIDFEAACAEQGLKVVAPDDPAGVACAAWIEVVGNRDEHIGRHGRMADFVLVPKPSGITPPPPSFEAAVRDTGRPVVMIPRQRRGPVTLDRIAIGWNGSKEVAHAVAAAGPCLATAQSVTVLCTAKRMRMFPGGDAAVTYLARHGIRGDLVIVDPGHGSVGEALLEQAAAVNANLLVVGGYSRSRMREVVMGGVTRHLLSHAELPVLMVH